MSTLDRCSSRWPLVALALGITALLGAGAANAATCDPARWLPCAASVTVAKPTLPDVDAILQMLTQPAHQAEAIDLLAKRADEGDVRAVSRLATIFLNGEFGQPVDKAKAEGLFEQGSAQGDLGSKIQLALLLLSHSESNSTARGVGLLQAVAATGDVWSTTILADLYTRGDKVPANGTEALRLLQPLVAKNIGAAMTAMGDVYTLGPSPVAVDLPKARGLYEQGVVLGDIGAKSRIGTLLTSGVDANADVGRGLQLLQSVADAGDNWTLIQIGNLYAAGKVVPLDAPRAVAYYARAASNGLAPALALLGNVYNGGLGTIADDPSVAKRYYTQAVAAQDNTARVQLALMLLSGKKIPADVPRAIGLLNDAAATGDVWSATVLAGLYTDGKQVPADGKKATALLAPLIDKHVSAAMTALGDVYAKGPTPIRVDAARARELFEQAAALGDIGAKSRLGTILTSDGALPDQVARGLTLLQDVADAGDGWTQIQIGNLYAAGKVVPLDGQKALDYYGHAAKAGLAPALALMGNVYKTGLGSIAKDPAHAADLYGQAVLGNDNTGRVQLSLMLLDGTDIPRDVKRAVTLLSDASATYDLWSTTILANLYVDGRFMAPDFDKAKSYAETAKALGSADAMLQFAVATALGPMSTQHLGEAIGLVQQAVTDKVAGATAQYGRLLLLGKLDKPASIDALRVLTTAADAGDVASIRVLLQVYRSGVAGTVAADSAKVTSLLASHGRFLSASDLAYETLLEDIQTPMSWGFLPARFQQDLSALRSDDVPQILMGLRWSHPNEFVRVLQAKMAAADFYNGPIDGVLSTATMKAITRVCDSVGSRDVCVAGPMNGPGVKILVDWMHSVWPSQQGTAGIKVVPASFKSR